MYPSMYPFIHILSRASPATTTAKSPHQRTYLDVRPVNITHHLEVIRALNITHYRLSYSPNPNRLRIGAIGPQLPRLLPNAVSLLPSRTLPPNASSPTDRTTRGTPCAPGPPRRRRWRFVWRWRPR